MNRISIIAKESDIAATHTQRWICEQKRNGCSIATFMQQSCELVLVSNFKENPTIIKRQIITIGTIDSP